jgi:hypothetical protein
MLNVGWVAYGGSPATRVSEPSGLNQASSASALDLPFIGILSAKILLRSG